jgi:hypothetical protein
MLLPAPPTRANHPWRGGFALGRRGKHRHMEHIVPARRGRHRGFGLTSNVLSFVSRSLREFDDHLVTLCGCDDAAVCDICEPAAA